MATQLDTDWWGKLVVERKRGKENENHGAKASSLRAEAKLGGRRAGAKKIQQGS